MKAVLPFLLLTTATALAQEPTAPPTSKIPPQPRESWSAIQLKPDDKPAFPEPPAGWDVKRDNIPHGKLEMISYDSKTVGTRRKMNVYTPPSYSTEKKYPVLYLLHGIGDIFKHIPAFLVFERDLLDDIIPTIESRYNVQSDRGHRALAGLSMGGGQTMNIGFAHLDRFAWLGAFSSGPNAKRIDDLLPDPAAAKQLKLLWLSCGSRDGLLHVSQELHAEMAAKNVPHIWHVTDHAHDAPEWKQALYWFVQKLSFY